MTPTRHWTTIATSVTVGVIVGLGAALVASRTPGSHANDVQPIGTTTSPASAELREEIKTLVHDLQLIEKGLSTLLDEQARRTLEEPSLGGRRLVDSSHAEYSEILGAIQECKDMLEKLSATFLASLPVLSQLEPALGPTEPQPPVSLSGLRGRSSAELTKLLKLRTFEDVYSQLGAPVRVFPKGNTILWEYDHTNGSVLAMRFVNGRVVAAYD